MPNVSKNTQSKRSAGRGSKPAAQTRKNSTPRTAPRKTAPRTAAATQRKPAAQQAVRKSWLSPQQQREAFAFVLVAIGMLLLVLVNSGDAGAVGAGIVGWINTAFGNGALLAPILLIAVGGLIIWQEQWEDAPFTAANVVGVALLLLTLLAAADFNATRANFAIAERSIGGIIDRTLIGAFGAAGAAVLLGLAVLLGIMLTFNVGLRQLFGLLQRSVQGVWSVVRGPKVERINRDEDFSIEPVPFADEMKARRTTRPPLNGGQSTKGAKVFSPKIEPASPDTAPTPQRPVMFTPIAERPTQAELFERLDAVAKPAPPKVDATTTPQGNTADQPGAVQPKPDAKSQPKAAQSITPEKEEIAELDVSGTGQSWAVPTLGALDTFAAYAIDTNEQRTKARIIEHTLASFKIEAQVVGMRPGPAVTQYQLQPAVGVKVSRIMGLDKDLALALAAPSIRIEAPIPGTSYIGIEIPNRSIASVSMRETLDTDEFRFHKGKLRLTVGKDVSGTPVVTDLTKAPHLLIAGSTGSGKSIAINSIICTLLMQHTPDDLKFIMVDPKMVELITYNHIPHLLAPVVTELERVVSLLKWSVREMERRYKLLAQKGFRNIESYNKIARGGNSDLEPLPYIVIIIDELADLMMLAPDEVETLICRLAQMARAIGIHLILATQRPSVDVVTGLIKANFPTRMAFAVTSQIDSRVILDTVGAEQLLGKGDMLYLASDAAKPVRVQGTYVSDREIEEITRFWREAGARKPANEPSTPPRKPLPLKAAAGDTANGATTAPALEAIGVSPLPAAHTGQLSLDEQDALLPKAMELVKQHDRASASLLQRRLRIGYSKAAQLLDLLEQQGIVGPPEDGRSREVVKQGAPDSEL